MAEKNWANKNSNLAEIILRMTPETDRGGKIRFRRGSP